MHAVINPCDSSPCVNGSCNPLGPFDYACQCAAGYTGHNCEANIDDCLSVTCPSNSMCVDIDGINSYKCVCNPDFMLNGNRCVQIPVTQMETQGY